MGDRSGLTVDAVRAAIAERRAASQRALAGAAAAPAELLPAMPPAPPQLSEPARRSEPPRSAESPAKPAFIEVEQAIYTSIRSPMGAGYRIVAGSNGLSADDRKQLTQRCPSHGNLSNPAAEATGWLAFPLEAGKYAVTVACHAGREHTARGGERVYCHAVVLTSEQFLAYGCDAVRVVAAMSVAGAGRPSLTPPERLPKLRLCTEAESLADTEGWVTAAEREHVLEAAAHVLGGRTVIVCGAASPDDVVACVSESLPYATRRRIAASCGVKFAPQRRLGLICMQSARDEAARQVAGQDAAIIDWSQPVVRQPSPYDPWLRLVANWQRSGRGAALQRLCARIGEHDAQELLGQVVDICDCMERAPIADRKTLAQLIEYSHLPPHNALTLEMLGELREALARRDAELTAAEAKAAAEAAAAKLAASVASRPPPSAANA